MDFPVSRELRTIQASWSTPQLLSALRDALNGGAALSTSELAIKTVDPAIALVVATSGSTGSPKQVALSASSLQASAAATNAYLGAKPGDIWSLLLPTSHIAGINVLLRAIELGTIPVGVNERADFSAVVPTQLHRALNGDMALLEHLRSCRKVLVGGGPLEPELRSSAEKLGINVVATYGMTESCGGVVYDGAPLSDVELKIIDGLIAIRAPQLALGYLNDEFPLMDGYFLTSDLGELVDGKLFVIGRADDQIISGGEKISLSAVDRFLRNHFPEIEICSFAKHDPEWGERLFLATTSGVELAEVSSALKAQFGRHVTPKSLIKVETIPYLSLGKPDRKRLSDDNS